MRLATNIVDCNPEALDFDMPVRVVFRPLRFSGVEGEVMAPFFVPVVMPAAQATATLAAEAARKAAKSTEAKLAKGEDIGVLGGFLGGRGPEGYRANVRAAIKRIRKAGKAPGILAPVEADARRYLELGRLFVAIGGKLAWLGMKPELGRAYASYEYGTIF